MFYFFFVTLPAKLQYYATYNKYTTIGDPLVADDLHTVNRPDSG